MFPNC